MRGAQIGEEVGGLPGAAVVYAVLAAVRCEYRSAVDGGEGAVAPVDAEQPAVGEPAEGPFGRPLLDAEIRIRDYPADVPVEAVVRLRSDQGVAVLTGEAPV